MIRSINLDGMFVPTQHSEIEFKMHKVNGGEIHIKLNNAIDYSNIERVVITHRIKNADDIMQVLICKDALYRKGVKVCDLVIPYIPYARQDRQCFNGESFTLKVFATLINNAKFDNVYVLDAHSDVAPALIDNCINLSNDQYVAKAVKSIRDLNDDNEIFLISPDAGSNKKANGLFTRSNLFTELIKCDKRRNLSNGELSGFEVFSNGLSGKNCLIVDDICDNGGTFMGLAEELKKKNCGKLYLFVTHSIMPNGADKLNEIFDGIYSTNSFRDIENIKQFKIQL